MKYFLTILAILLAGRTLLWHLQNWQIREYRWDRVKAYFQTAEGRKNLLNLWFFRGILPRPKFSARILLIIFITLFLVGIDYFAGIYFTQKFADSDLLQLTNFFFNLEPYWQVLIYERFLWLFIFLAVKISDTPVLIRKKRVYANALQIIKSRDKNIKIIGITGSYGKSSTRKILTHLLMQEFGKNYVLTNPENENTELAIARLIIKNREFFAQPSSQKRFFVVEIGAYRRGEIKTVCDFLLPEIGILTGINNQHLSLFGSQKNIVHGKFELAEAVSEKVFFNADNKFLTEIFADKKIKAVPIGISRNSASVLQKDIKQTVFKIYGQEFVLPWGGEFFVDNALLALETVRELGGTIENLAKNLATLPPLEKALNISQQANGSFLLFDLYSQNKSGVFSAIEHLSKFRGKLVFVGTPLLELGAESKKVHHELFNKLKNIQAEVFWAKAEFSNLGKEICGENFHGTDWPLLKKIRENLQKNEAILYSGRLPENLIK